MCLASAQRPGNQKKSNTDAISRNNKQAVGELGDFARHGRKEGHATVWGDSCASLPEVRFTSWAATPRFSRNLREIRERGEINDELRNERLGPICRTCG